MYGTEICLAGFMGLLVFAFEGRSLWMQLGDGLSLAQNFSDVATVGTTAYQHSLHRFLSGRFSRVN